MLGLVTKDGFCEVAATEIIFNACQNNSERASEIVRYHEGIYLVTFRSLEEEGFFRAVVRRKDLQVLAVAYVDQFDI